MSTTPTPIPTTQALALLTNGGAWLVTYPHPHPGTGPRSTHQVRDHATRRSFGLVWSNGTELRTAGVMFDIIPATGALHAYEREGGRYFATYTPLADGVDPTV